MRNSPVTTNVREGGEEVVLEQRFPSSSWRRPCWSSYPHRPSGNLERTLRQTGWIFPEGHALPQLCPSHAMPLNLNEPHPTGWLNSLLGCSLDASPRSCPAIAGPGPPCPACLVWLLRDGPKQPLHDATLPVSGKANSVCGPGECAVVRSAAADVQ